jgi:hypothetical protein
LLFEKCDLFLEILPYDITVTVVPEPEQYTLFLVGLGLMGILARRRNRVQR